VLDGAASSHDRPLSGAVTPGPRHQRRTFDRWRGLGVLTGPLPRTR